MPRMWTLTCLVCAVLAYATLGRADGVILDGMSARSLGRGGTNIGHFDNGAVLHDNPAAMVHLPGDGLVDAGTVMLLSDFGYSDSTNVVSDTTFTPLPQLAYIRKSNDGVWAYGLGVFAPAGFIETYKMEGPSTFPGERTYKSFGALMKVLPAVSCLLTDDLAIGGSFGVGVCHAELEGPYTLQGPGLLTGTPTLLDMQGTGATPVWSLGMQYNLTSRTTIGATYISQSHFNLHGSTAVDVYKFASTRYKSELDVTWPQSLGIGIRHELCPHRIFSADVIWYDWSSAFDEFTLRLRSPSTMGFPEIDEHFPLQWRDSVSPRLGYEHHIGRGRTFRLGYVYHRNPVPSATLTPFIQAILEQSVSIGYGWRALGCEVDVSYMFLFGRDQSVETSRFVGGDFDSSRHEAAMHAINIGLMKRL